MSNRDRWIVYPLLLFAILLGARDKFMDQADYRYLSCNELTVTSLDGRPLVTIGGSRSGQVVMYAPLSASDEGVPVGAAARTGSSSHRTVELGAESAGGFVKIFGPPGAPTLKVGHQEPDRLSGLVAVDDHGEPVAASATASATDAWGLTVRWDWPNTDASDDAQPSLPEQGDVAPQSDGRAD